MRKNKIVGFVMTGALTLGIIGGGVEAFAASNTASTSTVSVEKAANVQASSDNVTKQKVQAIMKDLTGKLTKLGVQLPGKGGHRGHGDQLANLDSATKAKAQKIMDQERKGSITHDQAEAKLKALGVTLPEGRHGDVLANLDSATKAKAQKIMDQERKGSITHDQSETKLKALGVTLPEGRHGDVLANLDSATKAKAQKIMDQERKGSITHDQAETKLKALGVTLPEGRHGDVLANLDSATKAKAQKIMDQERKGSITHDQAETKLKALGVTLPEKGGNPGSHEDPFANLDSATKAKAQALVKDAKTKLAKLGVNHLPFEELQ
ncbi:hypothetical protein ACN6MY_12175 [Peribacillus sp. B-H-3]|uniref:hypothetical protein n=1 Tax=Peribacillus sp. B-H-3 TaxID=3400420 RepID=UPI003B0274A4